MNLNRAKHIDFIVERLTLLRYRIEALGGLNLLSEHVLCEDFYQHLVNLVFDWKLENLNAVQKNAPAIDLVDKTNRIVAQVSATATKQKVELALAKNLSKYKGFSFKFISISKDASALRTKTFANPHQLTFSPSADIHDIESLLAAIKPLGASKQVAVCELLEKELKGDPPPEKVESNLAQIIGVLSRENWDQRDKTIETIPFDIGDKITVNQLAKAKILIDDYTIHYTRIDKIYSEFDKQGTNKSISILDGMRAEYAALRGTGTPDEIFFRIIDKVAALVRKSSNYSTIPDDELLLCIRILVVDAFIRCKIFENPLHHAHS